MRKRQVNSGCNSCGKLDKRGDGTGVDNYSPGTADKCATDSVLFMFVLLSYIYL